MKKPIKLLCWLLLSAALLFFLWARLDCPRLSAESAMRRVESANLAPESTFVTACDLGSVYMTTGGNYQRYLAAGVTDTHLHMAELRNQVWLWYCDEGTYRPLVSVPLEGGPVAGIAPNGWPFDHFFYLYTSRPAANWVATLTLGDLFYTTEGTCDPSGFTLFEFPQLENCSEAVSNDLNARAYDMLGIGYPKDYKTVDISLTVALFDENGQPAGFAAAEYPVS